MLNDISRRRFLAGSAAFGAAVLGQPWSNVLHAADGTITVRVEDDIKNLDPANRTGVIDGNIIFAVYQNLVKFKPGSTEWENDAAEEITQVSDTLIEFRLKEGLKFSDGYGDLTAEDVKFSYERFKEGEDGSKVAYASDWATLDHVEVTGPLTGRIHLTAPSPAIWTIALADISGAIVSQRAVTELGDQFQTKPVGSGPYVLSEWEPREHFTLTVNPDYVGDAPTYTTIIGRPIADDRTAQLALQAGEIDFTRIDPAAAPEIEAVSGLKVEKLSAIDYVWVGPNIAKAPFDDIRVREAIRKAIDVPAIIAAAYNGAVNRANALQAPGILGHWADAPVHERDVEGAIALLEEAGQGGGFTTKLTVLNRAVQQTTAAVIQANLAEIGITVEIEALDGGAYWAYGENDASADLELVLVEYRGKFDPGFQTQWFTTDQIGTWNWQRWSNPDFDRLHAEANTESDSTVREQKYIEMQQLMEESAAFIWITHNAYTYGYKDTIAPAILPNANNWLYASFKPTA